MTEKSASSLTPRQELFVAEYLVDLNATQAAIRAGYSPKTAHVQGPRLLGNVAVCEAVSKARQKLVKRTEVTQDRVIAELAKIGFSDIRRAVAWRTDVAVAAPDERSLDEIMEEGPGEVRHAITNQVELVDSDRIDDDTAAAIAEISQTDKGGLKVKFHDKQAALVSLARHLGMFTDKVDLRAAVATAKVDPGDGPDAAKAYEAMLKGL